MVSGDGLVEAKVEPMLVLEKVCYSAVSGVSGVLSSMTGASNVSGLATFTVISV